MSAWPFVCPSISSHQSVCLSVSVSPPVCLSVCMFVCMCLCLSISMSVSVFVCLSIHLSVYYYYWLLLLYVCFPVCPSLCLLVCLSWLCGSQAIYLTYSNNCSGAMLGWLLKHLDVYTCRSRKNPQKVGIVTHCNLKASVVLSFTYDAYHASNSTMPLSFWHSATPISTHVRTLWWFVVIFNLFTAHTQVLLFRAVTKHFGFFIGTQYCNCHKTRLLSFTL